MCAAASEFWINAQERVLGALKSWNHGVFDSYTGQVMLGGLGLSIFGLASSRLRGRGILAIGALLVLLILARGFFPNALVWGFLGVAILATFLLRPVNRMLLVILLLLAFCMLATALRIMLISI